MNTDYYILNNQIISVNFCENLSPDWFINVFGILYKGLPGIVE